MFQCSPGTDRQPSSNSHSPRASLIAGFHDALRAFPDVVHEEPLVDPHLCGCEAHAGSLVHRGDHVLGELGKVAVQLLDLASTLPQHRVAEETNGIDGHARSVVRAAQLALGRERRQNYRPVPKQWQNCSQQPARAPERSNAEMSSLTQRGIVGGPAGSGAPVAGRRRRRSCRRRLRRGRLRLFLRVTVLDRQPDDRRCRRLLHTAAGASSTTQPSGKSAISQLGSKIAAGQSATFAATYAVTSTENARR